VSDAVVLSGTVADRLLATVLSRHPRKSFGYLVSQGDAWTATDFLLFQANIRNDESWRGEFESYGGYFREHNDAGFVATPEEAWRVQKELWARGAVEIGVIHTHRRHPANFSRIDYEMHLERYQSLWHLIISLRNPHRPQLRAFSVSERGVSELEIITSPGAEAAVA
jgi:proteasome lid subunit RPN8/RPN11